MNNKKRIIGITAGLFLTLFLPAQQIFDVNTEEAKRILELPHTSAFLLVDARNEAMYNEGHIEGAIMIDAYNDDVVKQLTKYLKQDTIFVYCSSNNRTRILTNLLKEAKYDGVVYKMTDGIMSWKEKGFPVFNNKPEDKE